MESTPIIRSPRSPGGTGDPEYSATPIMYSSMCRKRKIMDTARRFNTMTIIDEPEPSPITYYHVSSDVPGSQNVLTSTMNDSAIGLSQYIMDTPQMPSDNSNFLDNHSKRMRYTSPSPTSKSSSAPASPTSRASERSSNSLSKSTSFHFTPSKIYQVQKIETPEKYKILYPQLRKVETPTKPKTPQKLREMIESSTPAKKKLFFRDPLEYFCVLSNHTEIAHNIFSYLSAKELIKMQKVSHLWRKLIEEDRKSKKRCRKYLEAVLKEKENRRGSLFKRKQEAHSSSPGSPPPSPNSINHSRFKKAAENLKPSQALTKCLKCKHPAVKDGFICQCINRNCGYIWCENCMSWSYLGPENFIDRCAKSELSLSPLSDLSNMDSTPSFLLTTSVSGNRSSTMNSSGYASMNETQESAGKVKACCLYNVNTPRVRKQKVQVPYLTAKSVTPTGRKEKEKESSVSPSARKTHSIGSKASKKNLRRLY